MDKLPPEFQQALAKNSTESLRKKLVNLGFSAEEVEGIDRKALLDRHAELQLAATKEEGAAALEQRGYRPLSEVEVQLERERIQLERQRLDQEMQQNQVRNELERMRLEQEKDLKQQEMELQRLKMEDDRIREQRKLELQVREEGIGCRSGQVLWRRHKTYFGQNDPRPF